MNEASGHTQPDKPGRMIVATRLNKFRRIGNNHTSFVVVCPFHASGDVFFLLVILFFTDFPLKFFSTQSASVFVYLHFAPFSKPHQSVIFVLGAKVGIRECKVFRSKYYPQGWRFLPKTGGLTLLSRPIPELPLRPERK